jgi:hypothetical protein
MAKRMWANVFPFYGQAFFLGDGSVLRQEALNGIAAELADPTARDWFVRYHVEKTRAVRNSGCYFSEILKTLPRPFGPPVYSRLPAQFPVWDAGGAIVEAAGAWTAAFKMSLVS